MDDVEAILIFSVERRNGEDIKKQIKTGIIAFWKEKKFYNTRRFFFGALFRPNASDEEAR